MVRNFKENQKHKTEVAFVRVLSFLLLFRLSSGVFSFSSRKIVSLKDQ